LFGGVGGEKRRFGVERKEKKRRKEKRRKKERKGVFREEGLKSTR
jgi:hypothetical protein